MKNPLQEFASLRAIPRPQALTPAGFHGERKKRDFFEGWYVKLVSADERKKLAIIPGIFIGPQGETESFVQVLNGVTGESFYHQYAPEDFRAARSAFDVTVGPNHCDDNGLRLDLPGVTGTITYASDFQPWPVTWSSPGIMGWYAWIPTMECYHGLLSFDHALSGQLTVNGDVWDFTGGRGYVEKDWGQAFPSGYVWMQTNHFSTPGTSLSASIAIIPWKRSSFRGFIVGLWHAGTLYKFATYTGAQTVHLDIDDDEVRWTLENKSGYRLAITADRVEGGLLHAPIRTEMHKRVEETLDATVSVRLTSPSGEIIVNDTGTSAGLEVHGDIQELLGAS